MPRRLWRESDAGTPVTDARDWTNQIHVGERRVEETEFL
jgi:CRISPR system Cascade subunit CasD